MSWLPTFGSSYFIGEISFPVWVPDRYPNPGYGKRRFGHCDVCFYGERENGEEGYYFRLHHPALGEPIRKPLPGVDGTVLISLIEMWDDVTAPYVISFRQTKVGISEGFRHLDFPSVFRRLGLDGKEKCLTPLILTLQALPVPPGHVPYMVY